MIRDLPEIYSVYGLFIKSNKAIPGLVPLNSAPKIDINLWMQMRPVQARREISLELENWYTIQGKDSGEPLIDIKRSSNTNAYYIRYGDGTCFIVNNNKSEIWASWPDSMSLEDTSTYLLGPVLGFLLRLRGVTCLHASAVVIDNKAVVLLGCAGAGKSTTAAAFANLGYPVLTEDVLAIYYSAGSYWVQPGYPMIRLWPESVHALFGSDDALPLITPNWEKRYLDLVSRPSVFHSEPLQLASIYYMDARTDNDDAPFIKTMNIHEIVLTLISNTYANNLLNSQARAAEFIDIGRLASSVYMKKIIPHEDMARLNTLCSTIINDYYGK